MSWDAELAPYIKGNSANAESVYAQQQLLKHSQPLFICPSDLIQRHLPRSYALSGRDMVYGWPPSSDDRTGVFLWWDKNSIAVLGQGAMPITNNDVGWLPKMKLSYLPDPANTLLITELITRGNTLGSAGHSRVFNAAQQREDFLGDKLRFHFGKFNYLMADGHVELLSALQTGGIGDPPAGIWTIKAGD
jgi:prepilin-type processing-associated H-X9-DG protein